MVAADVRRRILARKDFRLVTSAATALATMLELTLPDAAWERFRLQTAQASGLLRSDPRRCFKLTFEQNISMRAAHR